MRHLLRPAVLAACVVSALPACSTIGRWISPESGSGPEPADAARPAERASPTRPEPGPGARENEIRAELRRIEAATKSGEITVSAANKRSVALRAELEQLARAGAAESARARPADGSALAKRVARLEETVAELERQIAELRAARADAIRGGAGPKTH